MQAEINTCATFFAMIVTKKSLEFEFSLSYSINRNSNEHALILNRFLLASADIFFISKLGK